VVAKSEELDNSSSPDSEAAAKPVLVILAGAPGAGVAENATLEEGCNGSMYRVWHCGKTL